MNQKQTFQLDDLDDRSVIDAGESVPARFAVIGDPIHHSVSPEMHQPALDLAGQNARYIRVKVPPGQVEACFRKMEALGFIGCNVTVPHKLEAMSLCSELTEDARAMGATNTISFHKEGWSGHNTDGPGLSAAIAQDFGQSLGELRVLIMGAGGGAGRAIATQCAREGSPLLVLSNRTTSKLEPIKRDLIENYSVNELKIVGTTDEELRAVMAKVDLIINATSLGLKQDDALPLPVEFVTESHCVYDTIYNPIQTRLLAESSRRGARISNGLSMLVHQGRFSFQHWTDVSPDVGVMRRGVSRALHLEEE